MKSLAVGFFFIRTFVLVSAFGIRASTFSIHVALVAFVVFELLDVSVRFVD